MGGAHQFLPSPQFALSRLTLQCPLLFPSSPPVRPPIPRRGKRKLCCSVEPEGPSSCFLLPPCHRISPQRVCPEVCSSEKEGAPQLPHQTSSSHLPREASPPGPSGSLSSPPTSRSPSLPQTGTHLQLLSFIASPPANAPRVCSGLGLLAEPSWACFHRNRVVCAVRQGEGISSRCAGRHYPGGSPLGTRRRGGG